jgi:hypothetical protein
MSVRIFEARATQQMPVRRRAPKGCGPQVLAMMALARHARQRIDFSLGFEEDLRAQQNVQ